MWGCLFFKKDSGKYWKDFETELSTSHWIRLFIHWNELGKGKYKCQINVNTFLSFFLSLKNLLSQTALLFWLILSQESHIVGISQRLSLTFLKKFRNEFYWFFTSPHLQAKLTSRQTVMSVQLFFKDICTNQYGFGGAYTVDPYEKCGHTQRSWAFDWFCGTYWCLSS